MQSDISDANFVRRMHPALAKYLFKIPRHDNETLEGLSQVGERATYNVDQALGKDEGDEGEGEKFLVSSTIADFRRRGGSGSSSAVRWRARADFSGSYIVTQELL